MPKLWTGDVETHYLAVRSAILDAASSLVEERGPPSLKMSQVAGRAGIGRATLYKYFADAEALLLAWHERQVSSHLDRLTEIRDRTGDVNERLEKVLEACALIAHEHPVGELVSHLHHQAHVMHARQRLHDFIRKLLSEAVECGLVRNDVATDELANYCLHALTAASHMPSKDGVRRLVTVTLTGLRQA